MARHPEAPGGHCETIGTHRAFQQPCMRRRIYWNRKEKSMFQKTRSQGALGESEKKEADVDGLRNLPARPPCVLLVYGIVCMWLRCSLLGLLRWLVGLGDPGLANRVSLWLRVCLAADPQGGGESLPPVLCGCVCVPPLQYNLLFL